MSHDWVVLMIYNYIIYSSIIVLGLSSYARIKVWTKLIHTSMLLLDGVVRSAINHAWSSASCPPYCTVCWPCIPEWIISVQEIIYGAEILAMLCTCYSRLYIIINYPLSMNNHLFLENHLLMGFNQYLTKHHSTMASNKTRP